MPPLLPAPRGPLSASLFEHWSGPGAALAEPAEGLDFLVDDDVHLALWACYQLHYGGFRGVDDRFEWDGPTLAFRAQLEAGFEQALRAEHRPSSLPASPVTALEAIAVWPAPPLSSTVCELASVELLSEVAVHRSAYQLKEADPHTWGIPRLAGPCRAAMIEIQTDEYGGGVPGAAHSELFAAAMEDLGLCSDLGHYIDHLPGVTLATDNLVSMFGLHRRLRGALVGHLALFEMCSVVPMSRYLAAAQRVGGLHALERFYRIHVDADEHHSRLAITGLVAPFVEAEPELAADVVFGAASLSRVEARFAANILASWDRGRSSLRGPRPVARRPIASAAAR